MRDPYTAETAEFEYKFMDRVTTLEGQGVDAQASVKEIEDEIREAQLAIDKRMRALVLVVEKLNNATPNEIGDGNEGGPPNPIRLGGES